MNISLQPLPPRRKFRLDTSNSDITNGIGLKSLFLSAFTLRKGLHYFPGDRIFTFYRALGQICDTAAMLFTRRASEFYMREHVSLIQR